MSPGDPGRVGAPPRRVLVVEEDEALRGEIRRHLRARDLEVVVAASGEEAIALYGRGGEGLGVIVTDGVMPGMDGFALARAFARRSPPVPAILVSGFVGHFLARPDIPENIAAFLPKPFHGAELVARVLGVLGSAV